ncbi:12812_t:CDS:2 [Acaulospora morrowiae]|uniref:12812_t:CDS:1 n=1 Tax=Acaulospora morrowiae TaxID=94023 RepID=A0A9N8YT69_9GLOM|nr:12812_t:CDS:2 [Acaulospora morrowiae]
MVEQNLSRPYDLALVRLIFDSIDVESNYFQSSIRSVASAHHQLHSPGENSMRDEEQNDDFGPNQRVDFNISSRGQSSNGIIITELLNVSDISTEDIAIWHPYKPRIVASLSLRLAFIEKRVASSYSWAGMIDKFNDIIGIGDISILIKCELRNLEITLSLKILVFVMDSKQAGSRPWKINQVNVANLEDCSPYTTNITSNTSKFERPLDSAVEQKSLQQDAKQRVLKYQLHIRKNSQCPPDDTLPTPLPLGAHSGLLQELTFDQGKGQFLWASESYQGNLKKRRMNGGSSPASLKPYDTKVPPRNTDERHPSKTVAEMWREEPEEIKLYYQREADLALVEHKKKYPYYKYKPKKKDSKNKGNSAPSSTDSAKVSGPEDPKEDSQVPIEHRKQASMESAFTVFEFRPSSDKREERVEEVATPETFMETPPVTPIWADFPAELNQCPNCHHQKSWTEATLSLIDEQALSFIPEYHNLQSYTPSLTPTQVLENSMTSPFPATLNEADFSQFNDDISNNNEISIPEITADASDVMAFLLTQTSNWNSTEDLARYVVPSQDATILPSATLPELPPTPTSPGNFFPYVTNVETTQSIQQLLQLQTQFQDSYLNN